LKQQEAKIMKRQLVGLLACALTTTTALSAFTKPAKAISVGEALGIAAGGAAAGILINNQVKAHHHSYQPPQAEYDRGLRDGEERLKYDNPRHSSAYDQGYENGIRESS
jgi:hypothetical protein